MRVDQRTPGFPGQLTILNGATYYVPWMEWAGIYATGIEAYRFRFYHADYCRNQPEYGADNDYDWCETLTPPDWKKDGNLQVHWSISGGSAYLRNGLGVPVGTDVNGGDLIYPWSDQPAIAVLTKELFNPPLPPKEGGGYDGTGLRRDDPVERSTTMVWVNIDLPGYDAHSTAQRVAPAFQDITLDEEPISWADEFSWDPEGLDYWTPVPFLYEPIITPTPVLTWQRLQQKVDEINGYRQQVGLVPIAPWTEGDIAITATRSSRVSGWNGAGADPSNWEVTDTLTIFVSDPCSAAIPDTAQWLCPSPWHGLDNLSGIGAYYCNPHYFDFTHFGSPAGVNHYGSEGIDLEFIMIVQDSGGTVVYQNTWMMYDDHESGSPIYCALPCGQSAAVIYDVYTAGMVNSIGELRSHNATFPLRIQVAATFIQDVYVDGTSGQYGTGILLNSFFNQVMLTYYVVEDAQGNLFSRDLTVDTTCPGGMGVRRDLPI